MSLPKGAKSRALRAGFIGGLLAMFAYVAWVFQIVDAQGALALLATPIVAGPVGISVGLCWIAYEADDRGTKALMLFFAVMITAGPICWLIAEIRQMYGY